MPHQFDVYRRAGGTFVVVLQHDLTEGLATRIVAPLIPASRKGRGVKGINPAVQIGDTTYILAMEFPGAATERELGTFVTNVQHLRDEITRAVDLLFTGV